MPMGHDGYQKTEKLPCRRDPDLRPVSSTPYAVAVALFLFCHRDDAIGQSGIDALVFCESLRLWNWPSVKAPLQLNFLNLLAGRISRLLRHLKVLLFSLFALTAKSAPLFLGHWGDFASSTNPG